jgi:hypothetical protein
MYEWLDRLTAVWQRLSQLWALALSAWRSAVNWYGAAGYRDLPTQLYTLLAGLSLREQVIVGGILMAVCAFGVIRWRLRRRAFRNPVLARSALLRDIELLLTQLRGRAVRPARVTHHALGRRCRRSRPAFDAEAWDRLWAQWKQADREVRTLLDTLRRTPAAVVRTEQLKHLSTLRDTIHRDIQHLR